MIKHNVHTVHKRCLHFQVFLEKFKQNILLKSLPVQILEKCTKYITHF